MEEEDVHINSSVLAVEVVSTDNGYDGNNGSINFFFFFPFLDHSQRRGSFEGWKWNAFYLQKSTTHLIIWECLSNKFELPAEKKKKK